MCFCLSGGIQNRLLRKADSMCKKRRSILHVLDLKTVAGFGLENTYLCSKRFQAQVEKLKSQRVEGCSVRVNEVKQKKACKVNIRVTFSATSLKESVSLREWKHISNPADLLET